MRFIGSSVQRVEDQRILTGHGHYVDDISLPGMLHAAFLRSPHAHARIVRIDVSAARAMLGVVAVVIGEDTQRLVGPMSVEDQTGMRNPRFHPLASDRVRLVGDPVALVVAESRYVAEDARDVIEVEYEPLQPVVTIEDALDPNRPALFDEVGSNILYQHSATHGDVDATFARADRVIHETFRQQRSVNVPMETRGCVADFDPGSGELTFYKSTQSPHADRFVLASVLNQPAHRLRVIGRDVGGAFGLKGYVFREDAAVCAASRELRRPVKWIEDRNEHLMASGHAREEDIEVDAAVTNDGTLLGLKARVRMNQGAYPTPPVSVAVIIWIIRVMLPGPYRLQAYRFDATVVASNKASYVAYRGPWEMVDFTRERLLDLLARELNLDPVEIRRKNMIGTADQPTHMITGPTLKGMTARETFDRAVGLFDYQTFREEQRGDRERGRYRGFGIAAYIEPAPGPRDFAKAFGFDIGLEPALVRMEPDGKLTVVTAQMPHGQSHETTLAQVAADEMGVPFDHVRLAYGDTRFTPFKLIGTAGSQAATMAGGAVLYATRKLKEQVLEIGARLLEASPNDLTIKDGVVSVRGAPQRAAPLAQLAAKVYLEPKNLGPGVEPVLEGRSVFDGGESGFSQATHCCWVEVDPDTGLVKIDRYLVVEDCGTIINPAVVEGQVRGGIAQGIGGVLFEHAAYDASGQFEAGTFMDYLLPTTTEVPTIEVHHLETPPLGEVNFRGVGEGGAIGAPAALTNAIADALAPFGVTITETYLPPTRILELMGAIAREAA